MKTQRIFTLIVVALVTVMFSAGIAMTDGKKAKKPKKAKLTVFSGSQCRSERINLGCTINLPVPPDDECTITFAPPPGCEFDIPFVNITDGRASMHEVTSSHRFVDGYMIQTRSQSARQDGSLFANVTFTLYPDKYPDSSWEGIFARHRNNDGSGHYLAYAQGTGRFEGLQMVVYSWIESSPGSPACSSGGSRPWDGYIIEVDDVRR